MIKMYYDPIMGLRYSFEEVFMVDISMVPESIDSFDINKLRSMIKRQGILMVDSTVENVIKPIQSIYLGIVSNF